MSSLVKLKVADNGVWVYEFELLLTIYEELDEVDLTGYPIALFGSGDW